MSPSIVEMISTILIYFEVLISISITYLLRKIAYLSLSLSLIVIYSLFYSNISPPSCSISIHLHYHLRINNVKNILFTHFLNLSWSFHFVLFLFLWKEFSLKGWLLLLLIWLKVFIFFSVLVFIFRWVLKVWLILKKYQINIFLVIFNNFNILI
jgi:hypothetical protein